MKIAILGYGTEGQALAKHFRRRRAEITICDQNPTAQIPEKFKFRTGSEAFDIKSSQYDMIFKSPGIPPNRVEHLSNVTTLTQYFFENCPCPIIGVTGTKGKGTTSTLIYELLKAAEQDVYLGGNIGIPPIDFLTKLKKTSIVVLELSSFQAQDLTRSPHIGVILNVTSDHMDYHQDIAEYHQAKAQMLAHQTAEDFVVSNRDYKTSVAIAKTSPAQQLTVSTTRNVAEGAQLLDGKITLKHAGKATPILSPKSVGLIGPHNLENILPAITVAHQLGVPPKVMKQVLKEFKGLPHRLEFVTSQKKIDYYNDSFSTTPETSIAALNSFERPIHLIAGGSEKLSDFTEWAEACIAAKHLKSVILTGEQSAVRMQQALKDANQKSTKDPSKLRRNDLNIIRLLSLREAMIAARTYAEPGDVVLLSPACASFEEFENYKKRGDHFRELALS